MFLSIGNHSLETGPYLVLNNKKKDGNNIDKLTYFYPITEKKYFVMNKIWSNKPFHCFFKILFLHSTNIYTPANLFTLNKRENTQPLESNFKIKIHFKGILPTQIT
ncbi:hypothetical protein EO92_13535 [Methanosarcina sp. 2.H.A.1B.4]|nr:hypothetical protein EO92_13535 [Methanosarcina sp. 2.H.A.1B.4]